MVREQGMGIVVGEVVEVMEVMVVVVGVGVEQMTINLENDNCSQNLGPGQ